MNRDGFARGLVSLAVIVIALLMTYWFKREIGDSRITATEQLNTLILKRFAQNDFVEFDGRKIFGPDLQGTRSSYYATKLTREEVVGIMTEIIKPYVTTVSWGDDYGQYHGSFTLKSDPKMRFGLGVSFLKMKAEDFKSMPEIPRNNETDIIYIQPYEWDEQ